MMVEFYFGKRMVLNMEMTSVPRAGEHVVVEVDGESRKSVVAFVDWFPGKNTAVVVCSGLS